MVTTSMLASETHFVKELHLNNIWMRTILEMAEQQTGKIGMHTFIARNEFVREC